MLANRSGICIANSETGQVGREMYASKQYIIAAIAKTLGVNRASI